MPQALSTPRLLLRAVTSEDVDDLWRLAGDRAVADTTGSVPHPYERAMAEAFVEARTMPGADERLALWALERRDDGRLLGVISLGFEPDIEAADLGYWTGVPFWAQGYTTEAARAVIDHGFRDRGLATILATHLTRNPASHRVMDKIGMRQEGVLRRRFCKWGILEDVCSHSLLREEWQP